MDREHQLTQRVAECAAANTAHEYCRASSQLASLTMNTSNSTADKLWRAKVLSELRKCDKRWAERKS